MIVTINWTQFHVRYFNQNTIFVKEYDDYWEVYTTDGYVTIKCNVEKSENIEQNVMFVDRFFSGNQNVIRVMDIYTEEDIAHEDDIDTMSAQLSNEAIRDDEE